jgi:hypothetical protein
MITREESLVSLDELRIVLDTNAGPTSPRRRPAPYPRRRIRLLAVAVFASAALGAGGLAIAGAFGPLHGAQLLVNPTTLSGTNGPVSTCDLIGKTARQAEAELSGDGIAIEWRFMHWGATTVPTPPGSPGAITGGRSDVVSSVPDESIVWNVDPVGENRAVVSVEAPNDPDAPTISTANCAN